MLNFQFLTALSFHVSILHDKSFIHKSILFIITAWYDALEKNKWCTSTRKIFRKTTEQPWPCKWSMVVDGVSQILQLIRLFYDRHGLFCLEPACVPFIQGMELWTTSVAPFRFYNSTRPTTISKFD